MRRTACALAFLASVVATPCFAVDNPDALDLVSAFQARAARFEAEISRSAGGGSEANAVATYERFLNEELNRAYMALVAKLDVSGKDRLLQSQKSWISFRDNEYRFIASGWTPERYGDSASLARGEYRAAIVKDRTVALLSYLESRD